jgi:Ca-activated chloride channel family protein
MTTATVSAPLPLPAAPLGGRLVATDGRELPLLGASLTTRAGGGVAEVILEQRFRNPHDVPLAVTYSFPLPSDAAVSGYSFTIAGRRVVGEIDRRQAARERFEQALLEGKAAGLVDQERSSLFTQEIGNIPPGTEVTATLTIDQRLRWLDEGAWEWRFPTAIAPRYLGAEGRVADAARVAQEIADGPLAARLTLALEVRDALAPGASPASPSHALRIGAGGVIGLAAHDGAGGARLDRDLVVRWAVAGAAVGLSLEASRAAAAARNAASAYGLLTIVPPARAAQGDPLARDLIVLLDTSGSMGGEPLDQARRVVAALIETLGERDQLEMIEFSTAPRRWRRAAVAASATHKREALDWLHRLRAGGGTEMRAGILEALRPLRAESQRQIVLVTDGFVGFESEVVAAVARDLPASSRVHTVGVGSAVNRSLTSAVARAGRGVEALTAPGESAEPAVRAIVARTAAPLVVDLVVSGSAVVGHAPRHLPDLFAGAPALIGLELRPEGGAVTVRGRTAAGGWTATADVPARDPGGGRPTPIKLFGREAVEDLEVRAAAGGAGAEIDRAIETIGLDFQIATRLTSWVAVSEEPAVDPGTPTRRVRMPHELPHGVSAEGLGLRSVAAVGGAAFALAAAPPTGFQALGTARRSRGVPGPMAVKAGAPRVPSPVKPLSRFFGKLLGKPEGGDGDLGAPAAPARLVRCAGRITLRKGKTMAVAMDVAFDLEWDPGAEVELVWADRRHARARVAGGTRRGTVQAGQVIRLIVELDETQDPPVEMIVTSAGAEITVALAI